MDCERRMIRFKREKRVLFAEFVTLIFSYFRASLSLLIFSSSWARPEYVGFYRGTLRSRKKVELGVCVDPVGPQRHIGVGIA